MHYLTETIESLELRIAAWIVRNTVDMTDKPDTQE